MTSLRPIRAHWFSECAVSLPKPARLTAERSISPQEPATRSLPFAIAESLQPPEFSIYESFSDVSCERASTELHTSNKQCNRSLASLCWHFDKSKTCFVTFFFQPPLNEPCFGNPVAFFARAPRDRGRIVTPHFTLATALRCPCRGVGAGKKKRGKAIKNGEDVKIPLKDDSSDDCPHASVLTQR